MSAYCDASGGSTGSVLIPASAGFKTKMGGARRLAGSPIRNDGLDGLTIVEPASQLHTSRWSIPQRTIGPRRRVPIRDSRQRRLHYTGKLATVRLAA